MRQAYGILCLIGFSGPAFCQALPNYELHPAMRHYDANGSKQFMAILVDRKTDSLGYCQIILRPPGSVQPLWNGDCGKINANTAGIKDSTIAVEYNMDTHPVGFSPYNPIWIVNQTTGKVKACGLPIGMDSTTKDGCVHCN